MNTRQESIGAPSLLSRQKLERRQAVLNAAKALIKLNGYEQTTMESLARYAGLSTQTVYNYFGTKLDVLMELYAEDRDIAYDKIVGLASAGPADPVDLLLAIMSADMHREVDAVSHALWRQVASAEATHCEGKHHDTFCRMNDRYRQIIVDVMKMLKKKGIFAAGLDPQTAADLFLHVNEGFYRKVVATPDTPFTAFRNVARKQLKLLVAAFCERA
jgi:AcrR family transcriptional regulator